MKELNGKVENTHKQDDREFYSRGDYQSYESIALNIKGYNERWNTQRSTRTLGWKTPNEVLKEACVRVMALALFIQNDKNTTLYKLDDQGNAYLPIPKPEKPAKIKIKTHKLSAVDKYLHYLEWLEKNKLKCLIFGNPTMSQNFSKTRRCLKIFQNGENGEIDSQSEAERRNGQLNSYSPK